MPRSPKRVRAGVLLAILGTAVLAAVAIAMLHRYQVNRNAGSLASLARAKLAEGKTLEALGLFGRYLGYRPDDAAAHAEFARLVLERAELPTATREERVYAYNTLETAVRKNPNDAWLRKQLADLMLRLGRFKQAGAELEILRSQAVAAGDGWSRDEKTGVDPDEIEVLRSRALAGEGSYEEAAAAVAAIVGFDLEKKDFGPAPRTSGFYREASLVLASLLDEKLRAPDAAQRVLEHMAAVKADDFRAWLTLANWHWTHGEVARAAADVAKAGQIAPDDPDVLFTGIEIALAEKRPADARKIVLKLQTVLPDDERVYRGLAAVAMQEGSPDKAIAELRDGLTKQPGQQALLLMLSDILLQQNRLPEAEQTIRAYTERQGDSNAAGGLMEARLLMAQQRWLPAKRRLEAVRPLVATSDALLKQVDLCLVQCHERLGEFDEQMAASRRVLSEDHTSLAARIGVAASLAASGKQDEALGEFEAIAASLSADRLTETPQVWNPLLQLRAAAQMKRPAADRDWTKVDELLDALERSVLVTDMQLALLRADILVRKGDSAAAMQLLRKGAAANPGDAQTLTALAVLTMREQGPAETRKLLASAPAELAADPSLLLIRAQLAAREPGAAADEEFTRLESQAEAMPTEQAGRILAALGSLRRSMGDRREAERIWKAALKKTPDDLRVRVSLFELACEEGDVERARQAADEIVRLAGATSPQGRVATAATLILGVRTRQADRQNRTAPAAAPDQISLLTPADEADLDAAKILLVEAGNVRPGWSQVQQLLGDIAGLRGDMPTAIEHLQRAVRLGPANPPLIRQLVALLYLSNRLDEAQQALAQLGPDGLVGFDRLSAEVELSVGKFTEAVASAERGLASRAQPTASDLLWFGQVLGRAGETERAGEVLRQAVDADPGRPESWLALLSHQASSGQRRAAELTLERSASRLATPQREMVAAQGLEMLGRTEEAEASLREAVAGAPTNPAVARSLASFLIRRGRLTEAREQLRAIIAGTVDDAASRSTRTWARRLLAEMIATTGGYADVERALTFLDENVGADGKPSADDIAIKIGIVAGRPEPASWRRAIGLYDELAAQQPLSVPQRIQRAQLLEKSGRWEECRNELLSLASSPNAPPLLSALVAEKLIRHGELSTAAIWVKKFAAVAPESPQLFALRTRLAVAENDRPAAVVDARRLMPEDKPTPEVAQQIWPTAVFMEEMKFDKAADSLFARLASISSDGAVARAAYLGRTQRADEALDLLEQARSDVAPGKMLRTAVAVLQAQGSAGSAAQRERVERWLAKARRDDPSDVLLAMLEADLRSLAGRDEDAATIYRDIMARKDVSPTEAAVAANNLAFQLATPATAAEAARLVDLAVKQMGPHPDVLDTKGVVLLAEGKNAEAITVLEEAVLTPSAAKYLHLACALAADKRTEAAKTALAEARRLGLDAKRLSGGELKRLEEVDAAVGPASGTRTADQ